jgi:tyrosine-protein kinase Etk/Wzc
MNPTYRSNNIQSQQSSNQTPLFVLDYKKILFDLLHFWWLFAITIPLALGIVFALHRYSTPVYRASMSMLMEERGSEMPQNDMMEGFGLTPGQRSLDNQIAVLTSRDIIRKTIDQLDFHVSYFAAGRLKDTEIYSNTGFEVYFDSSEVQLLNVPIFITAIDDNHFELSVYTENASTINYKEETTSTLGGMLDFKQVFAFGEWIHTPWLNARIENHNLRNTSDRAYYFVFNHPENLTAHYANVLKAQKLGENSSIVHISVTGHNHQKNITFLKKLSETFINTNLEKKNQIATNTINFIEEQLVVISDSLAKKGSQLSTFRTENQIQDISSEAEHLFDQIQELNTKVSEKRLILNYYNYLEKYFSSENILNQGLAPAVFDIDNSIITEEISKILELNNERLTLDGQQNPYKRELDKQILAVRETLLEAINNQRKIISEAISRINEEKMQITQRLYMLPEKERKLLGIERQFDLNNEVYTFLLRKRSEAQIQKASNTPDHTMLETPRYTGQVSPQASANNQKALFIGILLPLIFIVLKQLLNNKITCTDEIEKITNKPVIGHIMHSQKEVTNIVINYPKSVITETFRRVRTRLEYMTSNKKTPIISVSSSMPGEGKTFCALNLAAVFAYSGKKTVLIGFDMRKPGLNKVLDFNEHEGLSQYYIGKVSLDEIIHESGQDDLKIIPSGAIPPNPSELISSPKTDELFADLAKRFDIIVLDTPPMGIVADPVLLARKSDTLIFLARQNFTIREAFAQTLGTLGDEGIENVGVLFNDLQVKKGKKGARYGYGYGYGYSYGYGQGYYEEQ